MGLQEFCFGQVCFCESYNVLNCIILFVNFITLGEPNLIIAHEMPGFLPIEYKVKIINQRNESKPTE